MPKLTRIEHPDDDDDQSLDSEQINDDAISLEELQSAYSAAMQSVEPDSNVEPRDASTLPEKDDGAYEYEDIGSQTTSELAEEVFDEEVFDEEVGDAHDQETGVVTPTGILEALLFVGNPKNKSYSAETLAGLMRGVEPHEVDGFVRDLNKSYENNEQALHIVNIDGGYRLELSPKLFAVRDRMFGKIREARLNQDAIDCLALVSYQPGITREQIEEQTNQSMGGTLRMLVRRDLLKIAPGEAKNSKSYHPTDRMLELFGLDDLGDLPHVGDLD